MRRALRAAEVGRSLVSPNPQVGAALFQPSIGWRTGAHRSFGGAHAEAGLLSRVLREIGRPRLLPGADLYLTLEPCVHHGKTGPCVDRVLEAKPNRVVVAALDPDPRVRGRGAERLARAGIRVEVGVGAEAAIDLDPAYHLQRREGRAWFRAKIAASLDGKLASEAGESRWVTGPLARRAVHTERARADVVIVGSGTLAQDDPSLDVREAEGPSPSRLVIDSQLRSDPRAKVWRVWAREIGRRGGAPVTPVGERHGNHRRGARGWVREPRLIIATTRKAAARRRDPYVRLGWEVWETPATRQGRCDLRALARRLGAEGFQEALVEPGPRLLGALFAGGLVDELSLYQAPMVLGGTRGWPDGFAVRSLGRPVELSFRAEQRFGPDLWSLYRGAAADTILRGGIACSQDWSKVSEPSRRRSRRRSAGASGSGSRRDPRATSRSARPSR